MKLKAYNCPACGASLLEGSEKCSACKIGIDYQGGKPVAVTAGHAIIRVLIFIFIALLAAEAVLAATLLIVSNT